MADFIDRQGKKVRLEGDAAARAFAAGEVGVPQGQRVHVVSPDGDLGTLDGAEVQQALEGGFRFASDVEVEKARLQEKHSTTTEQLKTAGEGLARGLTFGGSDALEVAFGVDPGDIKARKEINPGIATASELTGAVAPLFVTGGGSAAASGVSFTARAGQAARAAGALPRATAKLGQATEKAVAGLMGSRANTLAGRALSVGAGGAVEGAVVGAGQAVSRAALDDVELTAEQLIAGAGEGALLGGLTGGALGGSVKFAGDAITATRNRVRDAISSEAIKDFVEKNIKGRTTFRAIKGPAGGKDWVDKAEAQFGDFREVGVRLADGIDIKPTANRRELALAVDAKATQLEKEFSDAAKRVAPEAVEAAENRAVFKALLGKSGGKKWNKMAKRHGGDEEVGRRLRELDVVHRGDDLEAVQEKLLAQSNDLGEQIGDVIKRLDDAGVKAPTNETIHELFEKKLLAPMVKSGSEQQHRFAARVRRELESRGLMRRIGEVKDEATGKFVKKLEDPREFTFAEITEARRLLQREMGKFDSATKAGLTDAYRDAQSLLNKQIIDPAVEKASKEIGSDIGAVYTDLKQSFGSVQLAQDAVEDTLERLKTRTDPDLTVSHAFDQADQEIEKRFDDLVSKASNKDALTELRKNYQAFKIGRGMVQDALGRQGANRNLGMSDNQWAVMVGVGDAVSGGLDPGTFLLASATGFVHHVIRDRGAILMAGAARSLDAARKVTRNAIDVEKATDSAVRKFFEHAGESTKRAVPIGAAQQTETRQERYDRTTAELNSVSPDMITRKVTERMGHSTDDRLTAAYAATQTRATEYLRSKMPKPRTSRATLRPDLEKTPRVAHSEMSKFLRYADAVKTPMSVIEGIENGDITREGVEALATVYPRMYDTLVARIMDVVTNADEQLPRKQLVQLSLVLQKPVHYSMEGSFIAFCQLRYQEQAERPSPRTSAVLSPSRRKAPKLSGQLATASQRLEMEEA